MCARINYLVVRSDKRVTVIQRQSRRDFDTRGSSRETVSDPEHEPLEARNTVKAS